MPRSRDLLRPTEKPMSVGSRIRSWLRLANRSAVDPRAPRRVAVPHRAACRRSGTPRCRFVRGPSPGPRRVWQPGRPARGEPRRRRAAPVRRSARRPSLRHPPAPPVADVHGRGRAVARAGHRRELGDVQPHGVRALEIAAGAGTRRASPGRLGVGSEGAVQLDVGQRVGDCHGRAHQHVDVVLRVCRDAARRRVAGSAPVGVQADWPPYRRHWRQGGAGELRLRLGRLLPIHGRQPDSGPRHHPGRRPAQRRRDGRRDQRRFLGAAVRARPLRSRPDDPDQPGARHTRWSESGRVYRLHGRPAAGCVPANHRATGAHAARSRPGRRDD